jgi:osmotically-inducible protein OsmY
MQKIFMLIALASATSMSADRFENRQGFYPRESDKDRNYYQDNGNYYQDDDYRPRGRSNRRRNRECCDNQYYYQQQQPSYDGNQQYYQQWNQPYEGNQQYYQQGNQPYERNQQSQKEGVQKNVSDQDVTKKIQDTLGSGWFSKGYQNVSYDVNDGTVTLRGTVDTLDDKNKVEEEVKKIDGVKQVNNQIRVSPSK